MADEKKTYPAIPAKTWFGLRKRFSSSLPRELSAKTAANLFDISETSARITIVSPLKQLGILDNDNKPTELANKWRDDEQYAEVCKSIREALYPTDLLYIAPDTSANVNRVITWFKNNLGLSDSRARGLAAFFWLLLEADPTKQAEVLENVGTAKPKPTPRARTKPAAPPPLVTPPKTDVEANGEKAIEIHYDELERPKQGKWRPSLHIDINIHISPEASADQVDHIFESMAKHMKDIYRDD